MSICDVEVRDLRNIESEDTFAFRVRLNDMPLCNRERKDTYESSVYPSVTYSLAEGILVRYTGRFRTFATIDT